MEFKVLNLPTLTETSARQLKNQLEAVPGVERISVALSRQEFSIKFDETQLTFSELVGELKAVGCSLQNISAAILL